MRCRICGSLCTEIPLIIREKMFNTGETFEYFECPICKCIQIHDFPENMNKYYPNDYYSFSKTRKKSLKREIRLFIYRTFSYLKNDFYNQPDFEKLGVEYSDRKKQILDVGSGNGKLLKQLKDYGFKRLTGIDPFLQKEIKKRDFKIVRKNIEDLHEKYDVIFSNHSLEHMPDPHVFFNSIKKLLKDNGKLILRIPVYPNYIWDKYGVDWIQLDAPRHLFTFSLDTIKYLCNKYSLKIFEIKYDAQPWALASTEYCLKGKSHINFCENISITKEQIDTCEQANITQTGDSVSLTICHL